MAKDILKIFNPPRSRVQFSEGQKSKGILDDFAVRKNVDTQTIASGATVLGDFEILGTLSGGNIVSAAQPLWISGANVIYPATTTQIISGAGVISRGCISGAKFNVIVGGTQTAPTISFGDGDTGFYETSDDLVYLTIGGTNTFLVSPTELKLGVYGASIQKNTTSQTVPVYAFNYDKDTGIGGASSNYNSDSFSLIAGGVEEMRIISGGRIFISGSLGIGTITPDQKLVVVGQISGSSIYSGGSISGGNLFVGMISGAGLKSNKTISGGNIKVLNDNLSGSVISVPNLVYSACKIFFCNQLTGLVVLNWFLILALLNFASLSCCSNMIISYKYFFLIHPIMQQQLLVL